MAPESNNTPEIPTTDRAPQPSGLTIAVPMPATGAEVTVPSSPGGLLDFQFDPAQATATREDWNLVFDVDGGGRVVIEDFFIIGDQSLPDLQIPPQNADGEASVVASKDFFAASGLDMQTAAGGETAPPSSGSDGSGDDLLMTTGIDKLGDQGTWFWGYDREQEEEHEGVNIPDGGFGSGVFTYGNEFGRVAAVYEDGQPYQHLHGDQGYATNAGLIQMEFQPNAVSQVGTITISNLPEGATLYLGQPGPDSVPLTPGPGGVYTFEEGNFNGSLPGVYIVPPKDSDADFTLDVSVEFELITNNGISNTVTGTIPVTVDAVADKPFENAIEIDHAGAGLVLQKDTETKKSGPDQEDANKYRSGEAESVTVNVGATFTDVLDGSEKHYLEMKGIPADWTLEGWRADSDGNIVNAAHPGWKLVSDTVENGYRSLRFDVTDAATAAGKADGVNQGTVNADISFNPHDWTSEGNTVDNGGRLSDGTPHNNGPAVIEVRAVAEETPSDKELDNDNNVAATDWTALAPIVIVEDTPDFDLDQSKPTLNTLTVGDETLNIIGNVGLGEAITGGSSHGSGEFNFHDEKGLDSSVKNQLGEKLSDLIKDAVKSIEGGGDDYSKGAPLGIQHATSSNSVKSSIIEGGRGHISYDLHSDGIGDVGGDANQTSIAWDKDNLLRTVVEGQDNKKFSDDSLYSKLTDSLATEVEYSWTDSAGVEHTGTQVVKNGYAQLQFDVQEIDGQSVMYGFFFDADGNKVVALVGVLSPNFANGTADITFAQYTPLWHPTGNMADNMQSYFQVKLTDDDGDITYGVVQYRSLDDVATAGSDMTAKFDEKFEVADDVARVIGGNLLEKTLSDHDAANDGAKYSKAASGSDGWIGGDSNGVTGYTIQVTQTANPEVKFSLGVWNDKTNSYDPVSSPEVGKTYTILDQNGSAQGEFYLNANGTWQFSQGNHDVYRDFDIKVKYTVSDADGDTDKASLTVEVKAAPVTAGITGSTQVFESDRADNASVNDTAGVATYIVQAYNHKGEAISGAAIYEEILVTLKVSPLERLADLDLSKITVDGVAIAAKDVTISNGTIVIRIPAGDSDGKVEVKLPLIDDALGGNGTTSDGPTEQYTVTVTEVGDKSDKHYLQPGSDEYKSALGENGHLQQTTIIDDGVVWNGEANDGNGTWEYADNRLDGEGAYKHATDEHPLDGPMFGLQSSALIAEGDTAIITLSAKDPNKLSADESSSSEYADYKGQLSEAVTITIKLELGDNTESADLGNVTVTGFGGKGSGTYDASTGNITIVLDKGFDMGNLGNIEIKVPVINDNLEDENGESFSVAITECTGNESTYYGNAVETIINDPFNNTLELSGHSSVWEGSNLSYTFTYKTDSDAPISNGTGLVTATVQISGSATFGLDYVGQIAALESANPGLSFRIIEVPSAENGYKATLEIDIPADKWSNQTKGGSHTYSLKVPTLHDNQIGEVDESVNIDLIGARGGEINPNIYDKSSDDYNASLKVQATGTIEDRAELELHAADPKGDNAQVHTDIYEDARSGQTVGTYEVQFKHADGTANAVFGGTQINTASGDVAGSSFSFDISLRDGKAKFDSDMSNNVDKGGKDADTGDYGWAIPVFGEDENGGTIITGHTLVEYGDLVQRGEDGKPVDDFDSDGKALSNAAQDALIEAINQALVVQGFATVTVVNGVNVYSGIYVTDVSNEGRTLTFQVDQGSSLDRPLPISVGAIDDHITESNEAYNVILSNIKSESAGLGENVVIGSDRQVNTTIIDDANQYGDGFFVGLGPSSGNESDKQIDLNLQLFQRDANGNIINAVENNPPSQPIEVILNVESGSALINQDFYVNGAGNSHTVSLAPGADNWEFVEAKGDVPAHWEYKGDGANIPLNDDRYNEGTEQFTVTIDEVVNDGARGVGNESAKLEEAVGEAGPGATMTILDDYSLPGTEGKKDFLDGPDLDYFGPASQVIEPVAPDKAGPTVTIDREIPETGDSTINVGFGDVSTGKTDKLEIDGLVFTSVRAEAKGDGSGGTQIHIQGSNNAALVVTEKGLLGTESTASWNAGGDSVGQGEGIVMCNKSGDAIDGFEVTVTLTGWDGGSIIYQILTPAPESKPYGVYTRVSFSGDKGDAEKISITFDEDLFPDGKLPDGYSVLLYADGANEWLLNAVTATVEGGGSEPPFVPGVDPEDITVVADSKAEPNPVKYQIVMTEDVAEDTIVFINIKDTSWSDFEPKFGDGTKGTLGVLDAEKLAALKAEFPNYDFTGVTEGGYYVIIPKGQAGTDFIVNIKHDHDTAKDGQGLDSGVDKIEMEITQILGSENIFQPGCDAAKTGEVILDDMHGPIVSGGLYEEGGQTYMKAVMGVPVTDDVVVTVTVTDAKGNESSVQVVIKAGATEGKVAYTPPASDYIYTQVTGSEGGETRINSDLGFKNLGGGSGSGGNPPITLGFGEVSDIYEEGETRISYEIKGTIPKGHVNEDLSFTLRPVHNDTSAADFETGGPGSDGVTVTIPKEMLDKCGDSFTVEIKPGPDGKPVVVLNDSSGNEVKVEGYEATAKGELAQANDDTLIEGNEGFSNIITNIGGNGTIGGDPIGESKIIDNDTPVIRVVYCDADGKAISDPTAVEGGELYAKVMVGMWDKGEWVELSLGNGQATFTLEGASATGKAGVDYIISKESVVIEDGKSESGVVKIYLPDDYQSDGDHTLSLTATYDNSKGTINAYEGVLTKPGEGDAPSTPLASAPAAVEIAEYINGPILSFSSDRGSVDEAGKVGEDGAVNYWITLDRALEQDATLTFKIDLETVDGAYKHTADGFVLDDIQSIVVDGVTYAAKDLGIDPKSAVYIDENGDIIVNMKMDSGHSKDSFKVILNNDKVTEGSEDLTVTLIKTEGGELNLGPKGDFQVVDADHTLSISTTVTDVREGPILSLSRVDNQATEGESLDVKVNMDRAAEVDTLITLKLVQGSNSTVDTGSGRTINVAGPGGFEAEATLNPDGTVTFNVPAGTGAGDFVISFPLLDNATVGPNPDFKVLLDNDCLTSGETRLAGSKNYDGEFKGETNSTQTFTLDGPVQKDVTADGSCTIKLTGAEFVKNVSFTLGGVKYTIEGKDFVDGAFTLKDKEGNPLMIGKSLDNVEVLVTFKDNLAPQDLANAKLNTGVSATLSGMQLSIPVVDDSGTEAAQGFALELGLVQNPEDALLFTYSVAVNGKNGAELPEAASFSITGFNADTAGNVVAQLNLLAGVNAENNNGIITVNLEQGFDYGTLKFNVDAETALGQNVSIAITDNGNLEYAAVITDSAVLNDVSFANSSLPVDFTGSSSGNSITGSAYDDIIHTGGGNNTIYGGTGDDVIYVGDGSNKLSGGAGSDTFVWNEFGGADTISDFDFNYNWSTEDGQRVLTPTTGDNDRLSFGDIFGEGEDNSLDALLGK
ncbi:hypothetical protein LJC09_02620, partial [Desulfovibrio sp. OttesenSCG-928-F20]|nr:hypothetical protein [Desulfovibrio sp. OttesenSCG-928-F20]